MNSSARLCHGNAGRAALQKVNADSTVDLSSCTNIFFDNKSGCNYMLSKFFLCIRLYLDRGIHQRRTKCWSTQSDNCTSHQNIILFFVVLFLVNSHLVILYQPTTIFVFSALSRIPLSIPCYVIPSKSKDNLLKKLVKFHKKGSLFIIQSDNNLIAFTMKESILNQRLVFCRIKQCAMTTFCATKHVNENCFPPALYFSCMLNQSS